MGSIKDKKNAIEEDTGWTLLLPGSWCPSISFRLCPRHLHSFKCFFAAICVLRSVSAHAAALLHTCADRRHAAFHFCSAVIDLLLLLLQQIRFWTFAISRGAAALFRLLNPERITGVCVSCFTDKGRFETLIFKLWFSGSVVRFAARSATMFRQHPYVFSILLVTTTFRQSCPGQRSVGALMSLYPFCFFDRRWNPFSAVVDVFL
jgi:hypothetical protein